MKDNQNKLRRSKKDFYEILSVKDINKKVKEVITKEKEKDYQLVLIIKSLNNIIYEHFENFVLLDNVQIVESKNDKFVVIENAENMFAYSIKSNHTTGWKVNTTVVEAVDFIKKHTNLNIAKDYKKNIDEQIKKTEITRAKEIEESIEKDAMAARKRKIEILIEKFKNEPATLAVLSKVAQSLNA